MRLLRLEREILVRPGEYFVTLWWDNGSRREVCSCCTIGFSMLDMLGGSYGDIIPDPVHDMIIFLEPNIFGGMLEDYIPF